MQRISLGSPCFDLILRCGCWCPIDLPSEVLVGDDDTSNFFFIRHNGLARLPRLWNPPGTPLSPLLRPCLRLTCFLHWLFQYVYLSSLSFLGNIPKTRAPYPYFPDAFFADMSPYRRPECFLSRKEIRWSSLYCTPSNPYVLPRHLFLSKDSLGICVPLCGGSSNSLGGQRGAIRPSYSCFKCVQPSLLPLYNGSRLLFWLRVIVISALSGYSFFYRVEEQPSNQYPCLQPRREGLIFVQQISR